MSKQTSEPRGCFQLIWMFFMQPITLYRSKKNGIRNLIDSLGCILWIVTPLNTFFLAWILSSLGVNISQFGVFLGYLLVTTFCCITWSIAGHITSAVFFPIAGVAIPVISGILIGFEVEALFGFVTLFLTLSSILGLTGATAFAVEKGIALAIGQIALLSLVCGLAGGITFTLAESVSHGLIVGTVSCLVASLTALHLPLYFLEFLCQMALFLSQRLARLNNLKLSPIFWHDLSYFPLPFLSRHIQLTALNDPQLARCALEACSLIPGQQKTGQRTLTRLRGKEMESLGDEGRFDDFLQGNTLWQTDEADADAITARFWQTARYLQAAKTSVLADQQLEHLERAQKTLRDLDRSLLDTPKRSPYPWKQAVTAWQGTIDALQAQAQEAAKDRVPNPFRAGDPLTPDRGGPIFRGRQDIVQQIERQLVDPDRSGSIALLAPRRCGKTSLLQMLPTLLPDAVCIFFDLQGHPVDTPTGFFQALDEQVFLQARQQRGFKLPRLQKGNPFEEAGRWLDALEIAFETLFDGRRLLICLDEFAALENSFPQDEASLHKLMGLFRATIQHRRHVRLLVAGEAPFDELNAIWNDYFISVRQIRFGHLEPSESFDLVRSPTPEFPDDAIPEDVARQIVERTGSQPFLVQLYAQIIVERLNDAQRLNDAPTQATLDDLEPTEEEALEQGHYYFSNTWQRAPKGAQDMLAALARGEAPPLERSAVRWLQRRHLIDDDHRLTIPALGRFLIDEELA